MVDVIGFLMHAAASADNTLSDEEKSKDEMGGPIG